MADIDINAGLAIKADVNKLYGDMAGTVAKFREDRRYNKEAYSELLEKHAGLVTEIESIRNKLNDLIEAAQSNKIPDENEIKAMDAMLGLVGAKKQDGSLDFQNSWNLAIHLERIINKENTMNTIDTLKKAIELRKPVSYEYNKPSKTPGRRIGDPYALYRAHTKTGQINVNAHIVQTDGVSDSTDKQPLPSFRTHTTNWLSNVEILYDKPQFNANHPDYNPDSDMYSDAISKV